MKKGLSIILVLSVLFTLFTAMPVSAEWSGSGTEDDPYIISTADDLRAMATKLNGTGLTDENEHYEGVYFSLANDINMDGESFTPIANVGADKTLIGGTNERSFRGTFSGNGHVIRNLSIDISGRGPALFGILNGATIKNLGIEDSTFRQQGNYRAAALAVYAKDSTISGCYAKNCTVTVKSAASSNPQEAGGLIARAYGTTSITDCYVNGITLKTETDNVYFNSAAGGIAGYLGGTANVSNCYAVGITFTKAGSNIANAARVYGSATISNCYVTGTKGKDTAASLTVIPAGDAQWLTLASSLSEAFKDDTYSLNSGYPRLLWEADPAVYAITVTPSENGTVTAPVQAAEGATVALTVTPQSGYSVDWVKVNGEEIPAPYSFTMPVGDVTVTASFRLAVVYSINIADNEGGTVTVTETQVYPGTEVTLTVTPDAGYSIDRVFAETRESAEIVPGPDYSVPELSAPYTFIMPKHDVDIMVQFEQVFFGETADGYCLISTPEEYLEFRTLANMYPGANAKLTADLDMKEYVGQDLSIGNTDVYATNGNTSVAYCGTFDGNGHTIANLSISRNLNSNDNIGVAMFNNTRNATIRNLGLVNASINNTNTSFAGCFMGGFVAYGRATTIENCCITGSKIIASNSLYINSAGSIAGYLNASYVANCYARGNTIGISEKSTVGTASGGAVSTFIGRVNPEATADSISSCYSKDNVFLNLNSYQKQAGFVRVGSSGKTDVQFQNCYTDKLTGFDDISTMNKLASNSEAWKTLASSLGSAYKDDNPNYPMNGGAPRLSWEYVPDYEILSVTNDDKLTVNFAENTVIDNATLFLAAYNKGKLLSVQSKSAASLKGTFKSDISIADASAVKALIWDENLRPLAYTYEGTIIKGQLFDNKNLPYAVEDGVMTIYTTDVNDDYASFDDTLWSGETDITKIVIGPEITKIGANTFSGFNNLTYVEIPEGVTTISEDAFPDTDFSVCGYVSSEAERYADANGKKFLLKKLRILTIGNSHTSDHGQWNSTIFGDLADAGIETKIVYTRLTNGGFTMFRETGQTDDGHFKSHYDNGTDPNAALYAKYAAQLDNNKWDLILIQDYRESGEPASVVSESDFTEGIAKTMRWLRGKQPNAKIGWIVDWVDKNYKVSTVQELRDLYNNNTVSKVNAVKAMTEDAPDYIIPMGTALINLRTTYMSNVKNAADCYTNPSDSDWIGADKIVNYNIIERDGTHLSYEMGRYIIGAAVFGYIYKLYQDELIGGDEVDFCDALKTAPETFGDREWRGEFTDNIWAITRETVTNTIANEWTVTDSVYTVDPADAMVTTVKNATYDDFTKAGIVSTIKALGSGFTVKESDITINGNSATVKFLYGYTQKTVTITKAN